jgi:phosphocarrier protein
MEVINVEVLNELGIHARTAAKLVRTALKYKSNINGIRNGKQHDLKKAISVMLLNAKRGDQFDIEINGEDEQAAAQELNNLFRNKFGER